MILNDLWDTRKKLEKAFSKETAFPGTTSEIPSAGHCAAVAYLVWSMFGGQMVSTKVNGESHWFNRIGAWDVDLTGDQFGRAALQVGDNGTLYPETKLRNYDELKQETTDRARTLARKAGYDVAHIR